MKCYFKTKYLITALLIAVFTLLNSSCARESRSEINKIENKDGIFFVRNYEREEKENLIIKTSILQKSMGNTFSRFDYIYFDNDYFIIRNDKYYLYKIGMGFVMKDYEYISIPQGNYFMCYDGNDYILMDKDLNKICLIY